MVATTGQPYAYTGDDPVNGVDPAGLFPCIGLCSITDFAKGVVSGAENTFHSAVNLINSDVCQDVPAGRSLFGPYLRSEAGCGSTNNESPSSSSQSSSACSTSSSSGVVAGTASLNFSDPAQAPGPGWEWRGNGPPGSNKGNWYNPSTDQSLHPDLDHPEPIGPHYDYKGPDTGGKSIRLYPGDAVPEVQPVPEIPPIEGLPVDGF